MKVKDLLAKLEGVDPETELYCYESLDDNDLVKVCNLDNVGLKRALRMDVDLWQDDDWECDYDPEEILEVKKVFVI